MRLGEIVKLYLDEHNMSIRTFAANAGMSATNLSFIINGKTPRGNEQVPTIKTYSKIANAMGITTDELVEMVDDKVAWGTKLTTTDKQEIDLIKLFRKASDRDQKLIFSILDAYREVTHSSADSSNEVAS